MPTYQYACIAASCGHQFDTVQAFSDNALTECPECSGRLRKVWGSIGVVFKGSGFYRNDSRESSKNGDGKNGDGKNGDGKAGSKDAAESKTNANPKSDSSAKGTATAPAGESSTSTKQAASKHKADASSTSSRKPAAATS